MNAVAAARYVGYDVDADQAHALKGFYEWARRHGVRRFHRGSRLLFRRVDLDAAVGNDRADDAPRQLELRMLSASLPEPRRRA